MFEPISTMDEEESDGEGVERVLNVVGTQNNRRSLRKGMYALRCVSCSL